MAYFVCEATQEQIAQGYCPVWVEVSGLTVGTSHPVNIPFFDVELASAPFAFGISIT